MISGSRAAMVALAFDRPQFSQSGIIHLTPAPVLKTNGIIVAHTGQNSGAGLNRSKIARTSFQNQGSEVPTSSMIR
jgi:hypothetical protein